MQKIDLKEWNDNLLPYRKFFDKYAPKEWELKSSTVIPVRLNSRLRLEFDGPISPLSVMLDVGRADSLGEQGIYSSEADSKEFANDLVEAIVPCMSQRDIENMIAALQHQLDSW